MLRIHCVSLVERYIRICLVALLLHVFACESSSAESSADIRVEEYCQHETMKSRCRWKSEVIVMTSARWGRMKTGRCLDIHPNALAALGHDPLFLGCSADVLSLVDVKCSGRSACDIRIPDPDLDTVTPCYPDLTRYLEASYTCVKVVQESRSCLVSVTSEQQFISSSSSLPDLNSASSCGSRSHPWRLEAPAGQRINVSFLDFAASASSSSARDVTCRQYGYVVEKTSKKNVSICMTSDASGSSAGGVRTQRDRAVYTSDANTLDIVLLPGTSSENNNFLVKLNAIGCTNIIPPDNAWLKRSNNDIVIGCYLSQQTWQLKCDGHEWKGQVGECIESVLSMAVIAGAALVICIIVIATGVMCLQRCKQGYKKKQNCSTYISECRPITEVKDGSTLIG